MAIITADFEAGSNGATIGTADTGSQTAWNAVGVGGAGSARTYDNAAPAHGTLCAKLVNATSGATTLGWTTALGTVTDHYGRFYYWLTSGNSYKLIRFLSGGEVYNISVTGATKLQGAGATATTNSVAAGQWVRIEYHVVHSATVGSLAVSLFNSADSVTATETVTNTSLNTGASCNEVEFGNSGSPGVAITHYFDGVVENASSGVGPFPVNTTAPSVSGSTPVGSVLTSTTGAWNTSGTFTYTYQWWQTDNTHPIGGATSSTYTTVSGDAGKAVGCTVKATGVVATNENASHDTSNTITVDSGSPPANTVAPAVTGTTTVGSVLSCTTGTWTTSNPVYTYAWQRDVAGNGSFSNIGGATSSTYTLVDADDGNKVRCNVKDTDDNGNATAASNAVGLIAEPGVPTNSVAPAVTGTTTVGQVLSCSTGTWLLMGGITHTYQYQWQRDVQGSGGYSNIGSATASTYTLISADNACNVRCVVYATNDVGQSTGTNSNSILDTTPASTNKVAIKSFIYTSGGVDHFYRQDTTIVATSDAGYTAVPQLFIDSGGAKLANASFCYHDPVAGEDRFVRKGKTHVDVSNQAYIAAPGLFS